MIIKTKVCDICGDSCDEADSAEPVSVTERSDYLHTKTFGFTLSIDVCRKCQEAVQKTIDRLGEESSAPLR